MKNMFYKLNIKICVHTLFISNTKVWYHSIHRNQVNSTNTIRGIFNYSILKYVHHWIKQIMR